MRKCAVIILSVLLLLLLASCVSRVPGAEGGAPVDGQDTPPYDYIAAEQTANPESGAPAEEQIIVPHGYIAMEYILFINDNLYGRTPFSYRELEAARWIADELLAMGHTNIEVQEFSWEETSEWAWDPWEFVADSGGRDFFREFPVREGRLSQNVILTVPGQSEQVIVVGAHYDGFQYPGAADNASGVALLLESARRMLHQDNYYTIVYVFFGAEETGLMGAHFYLNSLTGEQRDRIAFMVNADALFEGPYLLYAAGHGRENEPPQVSAISRRVDDIADELRRQYDLELIAFPEGIFWNSDNLPFLQEGYTVIVLAGLTEARENMFQPGLLHSERDCLHYINEAWPGMAQRAMRTYSIFLERILLAGYE